MKNQKNNGLAPELYTIIKSQREFFATGKTRDLKFRRQLLITLKVMIRENEELILDALHADLGKSRSEGYITEIGMVEQELNHALRHLRSWNSPKKVRTPFYLFPSRSYTLPHPRGLVMIFAPWNYPFQLTMVPLISSIAAGNCTILKLSENSPKTSALLCRLIARYFDYKYVATYMDSFEAVKAIRREQFGLIFYTGGSAVARIIAKAAAAQLTPVVLEFGGKSPCIVEKTANLRMAARRIVYGKLINAGQTCAAPDYLFVDSSVKDELLGYIREYSEKYCTANPTSNKYYPKIVNRMHFDRLKSYLDDGDILLGGDCNEASGRIALTVMENIDKDSKLMTEEIFGPILPIFEFNDINDVIATLRKRPKPLALYVFTRDKACAKMLMNSLDFGCGCVNDTIMQLANPNLPFGGVGESGNGRYHGKSGFDTFTTRSSLLKSSSIDLGNLRTLPYSDTYKAIRTLLRYLT